MTPGPLPTNEYLRAIELNTRIRKASRNNENDAPYSGDQPEHLPCEEITEQIVGEITGAKSWELSEDEFCELISSQDRYACFLNITSLWHRLIIEGINSGECKAVNAEGLDTIAWRGISEINKAWHGKHGAYLWEPGTGKTESGEGGEYEDEDQDGEENHLPVQQLLF